MNKREILEIKKQYTAERCPITRFCGCYVDSDKNKKSKFGETFLSLDEEDFFKYLAIFKNTLSGKLGKNLHSMQFPLKAEETDAQQYLLLELRHSKLNDDDLLDKFYDRVIDAYNYAGNYLILLGYAIYDIPGKGVDDEKMFDASDDVFEHILCCICPVNLEKPCLSYQEQKNRFKSRDLNWIVDKPLNGFLFPAFNDRTSDIHETLYYTKKPAEVQDDFIQNILGCDPPFTAETQKKAFQGIIKETLGNQCNLSNVLSIHEELFDKEYLNENAADTLKIQKADIRKLLEANGASDDKMAEFDEVYAEAVNIETRDCQDRDVSFALDNITDTKNLEIKTADVTIHVNSARTDLISEKIIDGKRSIVITVEGSLELEGVEMES